MAKNGKLPKRIAGVKIPKKLRKSGAPLYALLQNRLVADLVAVGLVAAADALAKTQTAKAAAKAAKHGAKDAAEATGSGATSVASILALAAREGAKYIKASAKA
jgi:ABC-type arginine transport system permease subunit